MPKIDYSLQLCYNVIMNVEQATPYNVTATIEASPDVERPTPGLVAELEQLQYNLAFMNPASATYHAAQRRSSHVRFELDERNAEYEAHTRAVGGGVELHSYSSALEAAMIDPVRGYVRNVDAQQK